jgi:hypothetical protein
MTARPAFGYVVANTVLLWIGLAIGALALWPIYRSPQLILMVVVTTIVGTAIGIFGAVFRWSAPIVLGIGFVAFLAMGVPLAVPAETAFGVLPTANGIVDLLSGIALGWKQLVTISLPVGQYEALLVPFYTLIFVVAILSTTIALRARRGGEIAVLGPVVVFIAAIAFGPTTSTRPIALALGLFASSLVWVVWRRWYRRHAAIRLLAAGQTDGALLPTEQRADTRFVATRTLLGAGLVLVLAGGTAAAAASALAPTGDQQVLRSAVVQPFQPRDYASPLSGFRNYWTAANENSVMLTAKGLPANSRIRIATLDTYDGVVYSVGSADTDSASGSFTRVPFEYDQSAVHGTPASVSITVEGYRGVWLPTVGDFERVSFAGNSATDLRNSFYYNNTTGTAADLDHVKAGDTYTLGVVVPNQPTESQLASLTPGTASVPLASVVPSELTSVLGAYTGGASTPGQKLVAMIDALKKNGYVSHGIGANAAPSRSGHAADRINQLFTDQQMIGDAEQYSVAAALMAREIGFPARVVMGFVPESTGSGISDIRGKDVSAWIEVDTAAYGWVAIDPNPPVRPIPAVKPKDPNQVSRPQTIVPPLVTQASPPDPQSAPDAQQHPAPAIDPFIAALLAALSIAGLVILGIAIVLSPFLAIVGIKLWRRRKRQRAESALAQINGGWDEFHDRVLDHGFEPPAAATRSEVAATVGGMQPVILAAVADRATFSPETPDADEAELVWQSVIELTAALDSGKSRWERIKARISLRSFRSVSSTARR